MSSRSSRPVATTLEESLALWERGEKLADVCQRWLDGARERLDAARQARACLTPANPRPCPAVDRTPAGRAYFNDAASSRSSSCAAEPSTKTVRLRLQQHQRPARRAAPCRSATPCPPPRPRCPVAARSPP